MTTTSLELTLWEVQQLQLEPWGSSLYCHYPRLTNPRSHGTFWDKVDAEGDCWPFTGSILATGYGCYWYEGRPQKAHRIAFELATGKAPEARVLHRCDNPPCCRPDHLFAGSMSDNSRDMVAKGRGPRGVEPRLTDPQVRLVRKLVRQGWTQQRVADAMGCSWVHVSNIMRGVRRANVSDEGPVAVLVPLESPQVSA